MLFGSGIYHHRASLGTILDLENSSSRKHIIVGGSALLLAGCTSVSRNQRSQSGGIYYRVSLGETLYDLSRRSGLSVNEIMRENGLRNGILQVGQVLYLPHINFYPEPPLASASHGLRPPDLSTPKIETTDLPPEQYIRHQPQKLSIVSRYAWGASSIKPNHNQMNGIKRITIHHTSEYPGMGSFSDKEVVQKIAKFHRESRGWADIGYHYLIGRDGRIFEGRPESIQGAHVKHNNKNNLGISLVGNFNRYSPNSKQYKSLQMLLQMKKRQYSINNAKVYGHRDFNATACPGAALYEWLGSYRIA